MRSMAAESRTETHERTPASPKVREAFLRGLLAHLDTGGTPRERSLRYYETTDRFQAHAHPWYRAYADRFGGTMGEWMLDLAAALNTTADEALAQGNAPHLEGVCDYLQVSLFSTSATPLDALPPDEQLEIYERLRSRPALRESLAIPLASNLVYSLTWLEDPAAFCLERVRTAASPAIATRRLVTLAQLAIRAHVGEATEAAETFCRGIAAALRDLGENPTTNPLIATVTQAEAGALAKIMLGLGPRKPRAIEPVTAPPLPEACPHSIPLRIARDADGAIDPRTGLLDAIHGHSETWQPVSALARPLRPQDPEEGAALLQLIHQPEVREALEARLGVPLTHFSLREQAALTNFLGRQAPTICERAFQAIRHGGPTVARAFLACERQQRLGSLIIDIAEQAPEAAARPFFAQICALVDHLDQSTETLAAEASTDATVRARIAESTHHALLDRTVTLLSLYGSRLTEGEASAREAIEALGRVSNDTQLLASLFKAAARRGSPLPLEAFRHVRTELRSLETLTDDERRQMAALLADQGYEKTSEDLFPETGRYDVFLLRHRETILGFLRFGDADDKGTRHANFFCVAEAIRGSGIGEALAKEALDRVARTQPVRAEFASNAPIGRLYVEQFGFVGERLEEESIEGTQKTWIHIVRDPRTSGPLLSRDASLATVKAWADGNAPPGLQAYRLLTGSTESADIAPICARAWGQAPGALLTRYLADPEDRRVRYLVFETPKTN